MTRTVSGGPSLLRGGISPPEKIAAALYYAALRPSEAVMLREGDLYLPRKGWGRIVPRG